MKKVYICLLYLVAAVTLQAEDVSFQASAPKQVVAGQSFQLTYTVNQRGKDLRVPELNHFDVLTGPYTSQSSSIQFVNGQRTSSFTQTFTYTLRGDKPGTYTIGQASITVGHQTYTSNGLKITILPPDEQPSSESGNNNSPNQQQMQGSSAASNDNIFMRTLVSKTRVHEQECLLLQYKLYFTGVDVEQFTNNTKIPDFKGFLKQELEQKDIQTNLEHYNGRNYQTALIYQALLFPQQSGDIKIDPAHFEVVLRVQNRAKVRSIFDDFFGSYTNVTKALTAPSITIHADALPSGKPANFSGGVGSFTMTSSITGTDVTANDAITIKLVISGSGNLKLLKTPVVEWPEGCEVYDPKVTNNFKTTSSGVSGSKTIEYLAIPRNAGTYTVPPVKLSYFDIDSKSYKTLSTPEYTLHIARGEGDEGTVVSSFSNKEDIKQLGSDIRYIYTGTLQPASKPWLQFGSLGCWLCFLLPLIVAISLFIIFRKQIRENADLVHMKYKKANKVAQKRLKKAKLLLQENNVEQFYEEIERAALTYLSDRLAIPTADLNKDNISDILRQKGTNEDLIKEVANLLATAEFARYAPAMASADLNEIYDTTTSIINRLENTKL